MILPIVLAIVGLALGAGVTYMALKKGVDADKKRIIAAAEVEGERIKKDKLIPQALLLLL